MTLDERIAKLEEAFDLVEKKKKPYDSKTYTTGNQQYNIDQFNKMLSGTAENTNTKGILNGTFKNTQAEASAKAIGAIAAASPDGASTISGGDSGAGGEGGGDAGGCCEALNLDEEKIFAGKMGGYVELPEHVHIIPQNKIELIVRQLSPEDVFTVGYVTPVYFYKKLLDKFTLIKCTEMDGFTGVDYRDAVTDYDGHDDRVKKAQLQIDNPNGKTFYSNYVNTENNRVKSYITGMRKDYADVNKTVKQADQEIYEIDPITGKVARDVDKRPIVKEVVKDLKTILFYPMPGSKPRVSYYIDLKRGKGYQEISRDLLKDTIYKVVKELAEKDLEAGVISDKEDMTEFDEIFLGNVINKVQAVIDQDAQTIADKALSTGVKPSVRALYTNQIYYIKTKDFTAGTALNESLVESELTEAKRYVRRYYMRPQNIFCSNKDEVLKALIDHEDENCTIYTLNNLGDIKDVNKLTNDDIIYYYDDGILYDKNHVRIFDYELSIKHEEERPRINPEQVSDAKLADVYQDRMTGVSDLGEELNEDMNYYKDADISHLDNYKEIIAAELEAEERAKRFVKRAENDYNLDDQNNTFYLECLEKVAKVERTIKQYIKDNDPTRKHYTNIPGYAKFEKGVTPVAVVAANIRLKYAKIAGSMAYIKTWETLVKKGTRAKIKMDYVTEPITTSPNAVELKAWLINHITSILFSIPTCSGVPDLDILNIENEEAFSKITDGWYEKERAFLANFNPSLKEGEDYIYRDVMELMNPSSGKHPEKNEKNYGIWAISCATKFDIDLTDSTVPAEILELITRARQKSASEGNEVKDTIDGNTIISFYFGKALGMIFGTFKLWDISFYKNKQDWLKKIGYIKAEPAEEGEISNPLDIDFPNPANESLHEAVEHKCCICGEEIEGYGNNPEPYHTTENGEKCCDACNLKFVIPARLEQSMNTKEEK